MRKPLIGAIALLSGAISFGVGSVAAQSPNETCVSFPSVFMEGTPGVSQTVPIALDSGVYDAEIITWDDYPGRTATDPATQDSERVRIFGIETPDLQDGVEGHILTTRGTFTLRSPVSSVTAEHISTGSGPNSVYVSLACFTKIAELPIEPVPTTQPPTTLPPVTEPPTTLPPITEPPVTEPPITEPPVTEPPVTEPPVTEPPTTEPPVTEPPTTEPPPPCANFPGRFVPSYDTNGNRIEGMCQLPPGSCPDGNSAIVPGSITCRDMPLNESG